MSDGQAQSGGARKAVYIPPVLVMYGSIAKLTQNGGVSGADAMLMMA